MEVERRICSNPEIAPEDWQRMPPSVQQGILHVLERVAVLEQEVSRLRAEKERLREQTRRSSRNSSQPPSGDAPSPPPRRRCEPRGKARGGQPGHTGHQRKLYPVEQCRTVTDHRPRECGACGTALAGDDPQPYRHQVVELPEVHPLVDEHRVHQVQCPACGETTRAEVAAEVAASGYGP